ncbi:hypothetical protein GUJ93_ZPchr0010g9677 [Zizania palustris]|uniref:Uncharacterized protein n=1 Tax=Zizania palustris TaxID=103762 RepID=A0A8J5WE56_ZIZPA|nr:hypothetical protein GUJ93_ZPchr0010g9677 [Zizania palustris]
MEIIEALAERSAVTRVPGLPRHRPPGASRLPPGVVCLPPGAVPAASLNRRIPSRHPQSALAPRESHLPPAASRVPPSAGRRAAGRLPPSGLPAASRLGASRLPV